MRGREGRASAGRSEGTPGVGGAGLPGKEPRRRPRPRPAPSPRSRLSLPGFPPPLLSPRGAGPSPTSTPFPSHEPLSPSPPGPVTSDPGPAPGGGSDRVSPLPAPRLPLPEVFLHRGVTARPRGAPLHRRRLSGRHAVRAVRQRRPESEEGAAGAVGGAGGAGVLGSGDADLQGPRTGVPSEPEHPARLLQPERGR